MARRILLVGGAPRIAVDAVRHLTVHASGQTVAELTRLIGPDRCDRLLSVDAVSDPEAQRYTDRTGLEAGLKAWLADHGDGVVVLSAAINDYDCGGVRACFDGAWQEYPAGAKVPSGADAVQIDLQPAGKVIDQLTAWGHRGPLIGFKYQDAGTVVDAAQRLRHRVDAAVVVANSLDGSVQQLVTAAGVTVHPDRQALVTDLANRITAFCAA